jgi:hypothetical protein
MLCNLINIVPWEGTRNRPRGLRLLASPYTTTTITTAIIKWSAACSELIVRLGDRYVIFNVFYWPPTLCMKHGVIHPNSLFHEDEACCLWRDLQLSSLLTLIILISTVESDPHATILQRRRRNFNNCGITSTETKNCIGYMSFTTEGNLIRNVNLVLCCRLLFCFQSADLS